MAWMKVSIGCLLLLGAVGSEAADEVAEISQPTLLSRLQAAAPPLVIDVRSAEEYAAGHVPGAINIPHTELTTALPRLEADRQRDIVVYCASGRRAGLALSVLRGDHFTHLSHLTGDYDVWRDSGRAVEKALPDPR
jgi:rhodanese-related sulfurtransferase